MHFIVIVSLFSFVLISRETLANIYGSSCVSKCNFPGMICVNNVCKCDAVLNLFWTGARCLTCPMGWLFSDDVCLGYFGTPATWSQALTTCQTAYGDLISLRNTNIIPYVYRITTGSYPSKRKRQVTVDSSIGWTSAHAIELTNLGTYEWNDRNIKRFDSTSSWWCKIGQPGLSYYHSHKEPTRLIYTDGNAEKCVLYRRGINSQATLCLDDVVCDDLNPFICELSESTALKYFGPPSSGQILTTTITTTKRSTAAITITRHATIITDVTSHSSDTSEIIVQPIEANKSRPIIIAIVIFLLCLFIIGGGVLLYFVHRKHDAEAAIPIVESSKPKPVPIPIIENKPKIVSPEVNDTGLSLDANIIPQTPGFNLAKQKQQKSRKGAYTQQQFDEFE